jgi:hypothetical protein
MNNTLIIGLIVFAAILSGAFAGAKVSDRLPKHHLTDETKKPCIRIDGSGRHRYSVGAWAPYLQRQHIVYTAAVAGAVAMFVELEQGFGGLVRISPEPMRQAVRTLETEPSNQNAP